MDDLNFLQNQIDELGTKAIAELELVIVEDDKVLGLSIKKYFEKKYQFKAALFCNLNDTITHVTSFTPDKPFILITDISLEGGSDGLLLLDILKGKPLKYVSIAMTGFASIETAISATKKGVFQYLTKPFELSVLSDVVLKAASEKFGIEIDESRPSLNARSLTAEFKLEHPKEEDIYAGMIGRSPKMKAVFETIKKVAATDSTILITGPSGTGKELVARAIHENSLRAAQRQISINCGAIPADLLESELFGHMKGSFTGAISDRKGRFELAHNSTIFLDEIGDMPQLLQVKLLRVLQSRQVEPVGSDSLVDVNVRILAATHRDLEEEVSNGNFREDLFYRLNVIPIKIPALKERKEDIPLLVSYFIDKFASADRSNVVSFSEKSQELLLTYDWPGNVRELENVIERLIILRGGSEILPEDLPAKIFRHNPLVTDHYKTIFELPEAGVDIKQVLSDIEDSLIRQALTFTDGNKNQASKLLALNRTTLIEKMKKKAITLS
jgi:two-component system response regulator PilR (NtrC family)